MHWSSEGGRKYRVGLSARLPASELRWPHNVRLHKQVIDVLLRRANVLGLTLVCCGCSLVAADEAEPWVEFPHLSDETVIEALSCTYVPHDEEALILLTSALTTPEQPLPDDIVFTGIELTSQVSWSFEPVVVVGESWEIPDEAQVESRSEYDTVDLPFTPDREQAFGLGVLVEVPKASSTSEDDMNPPAAMEIMGAYYDTEGQSFFWDFKRAMVVSRYERQDPRFCENTRIEDPFEALDR